MTTRWPSADCSPDSLLYNATLVVLLGLAGAVLKLVGIALWPALAYHLAMTAWGATCLRRTPATGPGQRERLST